VLRVCGAKLGEWPRNKILAIPHELIAFKEDNEYLLGNKPN
jgi:hypothetical protein